MGQDENNITSFIIRPVSTLKQALRNITNYMQSGKSAIDLNVHYEKWQIQKRVYQLKEYYNVVMSIILDSSSFYCT